VLSWRKQHRSAKDSTESIRSSVIRARLPGGEDRSPPATIPRPCASVVGVRCGLRAGTLKEVTSRPCRGGGTGRSATARMEATEQRDHLLPRARLAIGACTGLQVATAFPYHRRMDGPARRSPQRPTSTACQKHRQLDRLSCGIDGVRTEASDRSRKLLMRRADSSGRVSTNRWPPPATLVKLEPGISRRMRGALT